MVLLYLSNFKHIGSQALAKWHRTSVDNDVANIDQVLFFQDVGTILNGFIGSSESIVVETLHAPHQI